MDFPLITRKDIDEHIREVDRLCAELDSLPKRKKSPRLAITNSAATTNAYKRHSPNHFGWYADGNETRAERSPDPGQWETEVDRLVNGGMSRLEAIKRLGRTRPELGNAMNDALAARSRGGRAVNSHSDDTDPVGTWQTAVDELVGNGWNRRAAIKHLNDTQPHLAERMNDHLATLVPQA